MRPVELLCLFLAFGLLAFGCRKEPPTLPEAMHRAAEAGDTQRLQSLISGGSDVDAMDTNKWTPLHWAVFRGRRQRQDCLRTDSVALRSSRSGFGYGEGPSG